LVSHRRQSEHQILKLIREGCVEKIFFYYRKNKKHITKTVVANSKLFVLKMLVSWNSGFDSVMEFLKLEMKHSVLYKAKKFLTNCVTISFWSATLFHELVAFAYGKIMVMQLKVRISRSQEVQLCICVLQGKRGNCTWRCGTANSLTSCVLHCNSSVVFVLY
jgi:hypothetical protein